MDNKPAPESGPQIERRAYASRRNLILVPVDFSNASRAALGCALDLAHGMGAKVLVLHSVQAILDNQREVRGAINDSMRHLAHEMLDNFLATMRESDVCSEGLSDIETRIAHGRPVERVLEVAEELCPRLIVMGSSVIADPSGGSGGSKTLQIIRRTDIPVVVVKAREER